MLEGGAKLLAVDGDARRRGVVVAVQLPGTTDGELDSSIVELERLATTLGLEPIARVTQRRAKLAPGGVLGEGKLVELARYTGGSGEVHAHRAPGPTKPPDAVDLAAEP